MVKGLKALKITSLQRVMKRFLHSNYTRWVKKPKFTYISFPDLFQVSQLGLKLDVSDIFDPSKLVMDTGIRTQFPVSPKDVSYKGIYLLSERNSWGIWSVYLGMCSWKSVSFLWRSSEFVGHYKAFAWFIPVYRCHSWLRGIFIEILMWLYHIFWVLLLCVGRTLLKNFRIQKL